MEHIQILNIEEKLKVFLYNVEYNSNYLDIVHIMSINIVVAS